jgi:hypothetical protein
MDVRLLAHRTLPLGPDLFAEIKDEVHQRRSDGSER